MSLASPAAIPFCPVAYLFTKSLATAILRSAVLTSGLWYSHYQREKLKCAVLRRIVLRLAIFFTLELFANAQQCSCRSMCCLYYIRLCTMCIDVYVNTFVCVAYVHYKAQATAAVAIKVIISCAYKVYPIPSQMPLFLLPYHRMPSAAEGWTLWQDTVAIAAGPVLYHDQEMTCKLSLFACGWPRCFREICISVHQADSRTDHQHRHQQQLNAFHRSQPSSSSSAAKRHKTH